MGLEILSDFSEILPYPIPDFPLFAGFGYLEAKNQYAVGCHLHPDFEFSLVLLGSMDYFINGENVHLNEGDGVFVNSQRLHYNYSREQTVTKYLVITLSPELFPRELPSVARTLRDKSDIGCSDYLVIKKDEGREIFPYYYKILGEIEKGNENPLLTLAYVQALCAEVFQKIQVGVHGDFHDRTWLCLHEMTSYVHTHFRENVTLADIAAKGQVCKSKCCQIFNEYMGQSPVDYLIFYRLNKSRELLVKTDGSIGEIASKCGFNGQSYYTQMFRRLYGVTPREYRKNHSAAVHFAKENKK